MFEEDNYEEIVDVFSDHYKIGGAKKAKLIEIVKE